MMPSRMNSKELCEAYGLRPSPTNESRTARRLVARYNLPYRQIGHSWVNVAEIREGFR